MNEMSFKSDIENFSVILTQDSSVDKVYETEVLQEIVLYGGPRQENPTLCLQAVQCLVRLVLRVLQPVTLQRPSHW